MNNVLIWDPDEAVLRIGDKSGLPALSNSKEKLDEGFILRVLDNPHVLCQLESFDIGPKLSKTQACIFDLCLGALLHNRSDLPKIASKDHNLASKWCINSCDIPECPVHSLKKMTVHHRGLIPDDDSSIAYPCSQITCCWNVAGAVTVDLEWDLEC